MVSESEHEDMTTLNSVRCQLSKRLSVLKRDFEDVLFEIRKNRVDKNQKIEKLQLANILIIER